VNFLAHCLVADRATNGDAMMIAGGVIGEFVKGQVPENWPEGLIHGVRLHRRLDAFSNQLASLKVSARRFPAPLRRFAPIFVDIIADHCLARQWGTQSIEPVTEFSQRCYRAINPQRARLSERHGTFLDWMTERDLLASYADWSTVERALHSITRRLERSDLNAQVSLVVRHQLEDFEADFAIYFPELVQHATEWVNALPAKVP